MKVLIAEDDNQLRTVLRHVLMREGCNVEEAVSGTEALAKISIHTFDLVLMDIIMPGREGIEVILDVRKKYPRLPIIAMSGGARSGAFDPLKLATDCGASFVIAKPFQPSELRALLRQCWPET